MYSGAGKSRAVEQNKDRRGRPQTEVRHPAAAPAEDKNEIPFLDEVRQLLSEQRARFC